MIGLVLGVVAVVLGGGASVVAAVTLESAPTSERRVVTASVDESARYAIVDTASFAPVTRELTIAVEGRTGDPEPFAAQARPVDALGWVGRDAAVALALGADRNSVGVEGVGASGAGAGGDDGASPPGMNPRGADVWAGEFPNPADTPVIVDLTDPDDARANALVLASDGSGAAPSSVVLSWTAAVTYPWAPPLGIGGTALAVAGLAGGLLCALHLRRAGTRDRRRLSSRVPVRVRAAAASERAVVNAEVDTLAATCEPAVRGPAVRLRTVSALRGVAGTIVAGSVVVGTVVAGTVVAGTASAVPGSVATASGSLIDPASASAGSVSGSVATASALSAFPAADSSMTDAQAGRILERVVAAVAAADEAGDPALAADRLTGSELVSRTAGYAIVASGLTAPPTVIASGDVVLVLPEATDSWPRRATVVTESGEPGSGSTTALLLLQETAREPYRVASAVAIGQGTSFPELPTSASGASVLESGGVAENTLRVPLAELGQRYEGVLNLGPTSDDAEVFDRNGDIFRAQVGYEYRQRAREIIDKRASIDFTSEPGASGSTAFATTDAGALAWVTLRDSEVVTPQDTVASGEISVVGAAAALSGLASSATGVSTGYEYQLLFAVPPAGSLDPIRTLGFAQGLVTAAAVAP